MWWNLGNWIRINPSWYLIIVLVNPWLDLWFWVRINPTWDLLIMWWHLWCFIWIDPWLDLGYGVRVYPCWNLGWLNICLFLVIVSWSLVIVCWSLVRSRSLIVVVASGSCLLISIPFILVLFVSSFFTLIRFILFPNLIISETKRLSFTSPSISWIAISIIFSVFDIITVIIAIGCIDILASSSSLGQWAGQNCWKDQRKEFHLFSII